MAFEAPVVRLVNLLIENAIGAEASDIHIEPFEDTLRIRYRIDGMLYDQEAPPRRLQARGHLAHQDHGRDEHRRAPAAPGRAHPRHAATAGASTSACRPCRPCTASPSSCGLLDRSSVFLPLEQLGFAARHARSGSRRSSSARTASSWSPAPPARARPPRSTPRSTRSTRPDRKIITIEDPVEYQLKGVNQIPVKPKIGLTLRHRPAAHRPPGPRRHPGRRDPRPGDGRDRHPGRAHRPPGLLHAAHQRRPRRHHPPARHGRRALPGRLGAGGRAGPAPGAPHLLRRAACPTRRRRPTSRRSA